jgi:hypothetical protein
MPDRLWAVTSYFNPAGYRRRRLNYTIFREHLNVPLIAVELSYNGEFELHPGDAEVLVQVRGSAVLWQKERLLNVALSRLPGECRTVAWLDCDIIFERADWVSAAEETLERLPLCQLYTDVYHLAPDSPIRKEWAIDRHRAFAWGFANGGTLHPESILIRQGFKRGHAWAARRQFLERVGGLYDRCIIGGGDKFMAFAAIGRAPEVIAHNGFYSAGFNADYLKWSGDFSSAVGSRMGYIETDLFHLWHGDLQDRQYDPRHEILREHGYDPNVDIALDPQGCWRWNSPKYEMHRRIREYFHSRMEDGLEAHLTVAGG